MIYAIGISFAESATIAGEGTLNVSNGEFFVEAGRTATLDVPLSIFESHFYKYGAGTLVVNAGKQGAFGTIIAFDGQLELRLAQGESVTIPAPTDDQRRVGGISYIGPGTFTSFRLYPRNYGSTNVVDGGATVILSGNNATDGLIVSGWKNSENLSLGGTVVLGDCTIRSSYNVDTLLQRAVKIVFTDSVNGTTISTDGANGSPITVTTSDSGAFYGAGKLNIAGSGTFIFSPNPTFNQTGEVVVKSGAMAQLYNDVPYATFRVEDGATLKGIRSYPRTIGALSFEAGGRFGNGDSRNIVHPVSFTCAAGETFDIVVGAENDGAVPILDLISRRTLRCVYPQRYVAHRAVVCSRLTGKAAVPAADLR